MNNAIIAVFWLIVACIICFVLLSLHLFWKKNQEEKRRKNIETYKKKTELAWYDYFINDGKLVESFVPREKDEIVGYEELAHIYVTSLTANQTSEKLHYIANQYLQDYYKKLLNSARRSNRLNALARIKDYGNIEVLKECKWIQKEKKEKEECIQLLTIYSKYDEATFKQLLFQYQSILTEFDCRNLFNRLPLSDLTSFFTHFDELESHLKYALIDTVSNKHTFEAIPYLLELVRYDDKEIRIRVAKAIYDLGIEEEELCVELSNGENWEERLMAAKMAQYVKFDRSKDILFRLLEDKEWRVRVQAAQTIARHQEGRASLETYIMTSNDHYAIETAQEVLRKEGDWSWIG
ncbi:HEAT repeat domain-containing protein [Ureibacillus sp. Re31]|uniref:HEAT repeat domain-containing protein n=1 Tax=Ureibacillus galli TaxID=2762222 RepID=A0ABR8XH76_9BACL|nr:HEAT repeat domain-containing protein [Ureibacillus galli]MBD8028587.1 HEAT repeat domain-containing protein [Ureibacillus galli]